MGFAPNDIQSTVGMAGPAQAQASAGEIFEKADKNKQDLSFKEFKGALNEQGIEVDSDLAKQIFKGANEEGKRLNLDEFKSAFKTASYASNLPGADKLGKDAAALINNNGEIATKEEVNRLKDEGYLKEESNGKLVLTSEGKDLLGVVKKYNPESTLSERLGPTEQERKDAHKEVREQYEKMHDIIGALVTERNGGSVELPDAGKTNTGNLF